jgi:MoaA/NifB/PqqE/SkfB family radical SAM enzyme
MSFYNSVKVIQIEHSSMCNAACPQCLREWWNGDYSRINQTYLPIEFYQNNIPKKVYENLQKINFCGTVGDPCTAPNFIEVCKYIKTNYPHIELVIATNGGMKNPEWWAELGKTLLPNDVIIFGIDGLEDTNYIYRVNVRWNKLINNVESFINTGGRAWWQFIVFEHNESQIEQAKQLSIELGFKNFYTIYNNRFLVEEMFGRPETLGGNGLPLRPPKTEDKISPLLRRDKPVPTTQIEWLASAEKTCIKCQAQETFEAYIDAEGHLLPCCYLAGAKFTLKVDDVDGYHDLWTTHGADKINLNNTDWNDILNGSFYQALVESWQKKFDTGRLLVCSGVCGKQDVQFSMYKNVQKS